MPIPAAECRRRADVLFELARSTEDAFERLVHLLEALELEARAKILEEEESRPASQAASGSLIPPS